MAEEKEPELLVRDCDCGKPRCGKIIIGIIRPQIKKLEGEGELIPVAYLPVEQVPGLIDYLRELSKSKGFPC